MSIADVSPDEPYEICAYLNHFDDPPLIFGDVTPLLKPYLHPFTPFASTRDEIWFWDDIIGDSRNLMDWAVFMLKDHPIIVDLEMHTRMFGDEEFYEEMIIPLTSISPIVNINWFQKRTVIQKMCKRKTMAMELDGR
jgi:hypothetical protein